MSLEDLYGRENYLRGCINAREIKIRELGKIIDRLETEIEELKSDVGKLEKINTKIDKTVRKIDLSVTKIDNANNILNSYYRCSQNETWKKEIRTSYTLSTKASSEFAKIKKASLNTITELKTEIRKKERNLEDNKNSLIKAKAEKSDYEDQLRDVQYDINHYDEDD